MTGPRPKSWYLMRAARSTAEIRIYEEIGLWGITAKQFVDDLNALGELTRLDVRVNSPGGDVFEAMTIHNALQRHPARVVVHIDGLCASAATLVALAGDETRMASNGQHMIHEPWTFTVGDAADHQKRGDLLDITAEQIVGLYARKTGLSADRIRELMRAETWMTAEQALEQGFVDAIDEPLRIAAKAHDLSRFANFPRGAAMATETDAPETSANPPEPAPAPPTDAPAPKPPAGAGQDPEEPAPKPPAGAGQDPEEPALSPVEIAKACLEAKEPDLIPGLLARPVTRTALDARVEHAREIRALCAMVHQSDRAPGFIATGATPDEVKAGLWEALVATDRAVGETDNTPPAKAKQAAVDPTALARAAVQYQTAQRTAGFSVSIAEAVAHVSKTGAPAP